MRAPDQRLARRLEAELLETPDACSELAAQWRALARSCPWATPFQSPEWALGCVTHAGSNRPRVIAVRDGSALLAVLPLEEFASGTWCLAGTGPSDVLDVIVAPGWAREGTELALACLARADWRVLELHELREGSPLLGAIRAGHAGPVKELAVHSLSPVLCVPEGARELAQIVPPSMARRARYALRRAAREGIEVERATGAIETGLEAWLALHAARWSARGEPGVLVDRKRLARAVLPALAAEGEAELWVLRSSSRIVAAYLVLRSRDRAMLYLGGFDPAIAARSPLTVLIAAAIERLAAEGVREIDFLRGDELYKREWGAEPRVQYRARIER